MAGNQEQSGARGQLFGAVSALAFTLASDLELAPLDENESEEALAIRLLGEIDQRAKVLASDLDECREEIASLKRQLSAQKGAATKARAAAAAAMPAKPRKFGPMKDQLGSHELAELIDDADEVQIAFTDANGREIAGIAPRTISGDAFKADTAALRLSVPEMPIHGPATGQAAFRLGGYALLVDGEQVAFTPRDELAIAPGQTYELKDDVAFMAAA